MQYTIMCGSVHSTMFMHDCPKSQKKCGMCEKAVKKSIVCNNLCSWSKLFQKFPECYDFIPNYYKTWEMSEKVLVDYYTHALEYIPDLPYV